VCVKAKTYELEKENAEMEREISRLKLELGVRCGGCD